MKFRGTACDQCKTEAKHPGHGLAEGPIQGWLRIVTDTDQRYDFCSIKCAADWLKARKRQQVERFKRERELAKQHRDRQAPMRTIPIARPGQVL